MSVDMIDLSKVKAGDTVTVAGTDTAHLTFTVTGVVREPNHSPGQLWVGPVALNATALTITDHQPAEPEWKPGTFGRGWVQRVARDGFFADSGSGHLMFFFPDDDGVRDTVAAEHVTDFVPDDAEALRADLAKALRERDEAMADAERLRDLFGKAKKDARTIVGGGTGIRFDGVQIIEAEIFVRLMQERSQALADKDRWITRHNQEVVNAKRVQDEMAEGIKKVAVQRDEARTEAQAAREVSVSERERAEEFSRQVEEEHERVDSLRKTIAKFHLIRCENDKLRTKLEEARKAALPTDLTKCACHPHTQDAGGGFTEYLLEYEPACPLHSEHVYDPRQGMWVESASRTMPTRKQVRTVLAYQYDNYIDGCFIGRAREDFLDDATDRVRSLFEPGGAASTPDFKKDNS